MSTSGEDNSAQGVNVADEDNAALAAVIAAAATAANSTRNAKPPDFIMGRYEESQADCGDWHIVAGGKPLADWSGIDATKPRSTFVPTQTRSFKSKYKTTDYEKRTAPMATKFKDGMSLRDLMNEVSTHSENHGLDTWTYLPDPYDPTQMLNVVEDYPKFLASPDDTVKRALAQSENYDRFDLENSKALADYLYNSLAPDLQSHLKLMLTTKELSHFICVWIKLLAKVATVSSQFYEKEKTKIRDCKPSQFPKESIEEWHKFILPSVDILISADMYEHSLTEDVLNNLVNHCSVGGLFSHDTVSLLSKVKKEVKLVKFLNSTAASTHMASKQLDPKSVLKEVLSLYTDEEKEGNWTPANGPTDRGALRGAHMVTNQTDLHEMCKQVLNLRFSGGDGGGRKVECYNCGEEHYIRDCPHPKRQPGNGRGRGAGNRQFGGGGRGFGGGGRGGGRQSRQFSGRGGAGGGRGPGRGPSSNQQPTSWRRVPPADGASETVKKQGVPYYWCAKCRHWNKTHVTSAHVRRPVATGNHGNDPDRSAAANLVMDPSAWMVTEGRDPSPGDDDSSESSKSSHLHCHSVVNSTDSSYQIPTVGMCTCCGNYGQYAHLCDCGGGIFEEIAISSDEDDDGIDDEVAIECSTCAEFIPLGVMCACARPEAGRDESPSEIRAGFSVTLNSSATDREPPSEIRAPLASSARALPTVSLASVGASSRVASVATKPDNYLCPAEAKNPSSLPTADPHPDNYFCPDDRKIAPQVSAEGDDDLSVVDDDDDGFDEDVDAARTMNMPKAASIVEEKPASIAAHLLDDDLPLSSEDLWFSMLLPFVYLALLWFLLPTFGPMRTACVTGFAHSSRAILSVLVQLSGSFCLELVSAFQTSLSLASVIDKHFALMVAALRSLHWTTYCAPALWLGLIVTVGIYDRFIGKCTTVPASRSSRRAALHNHKRHRRRLAAWKQKFHAPRLRGRVFHRPHQKPRQFAPTVDRRRFISEAADQLDHATAIHRQRRAAHNRSPKIRGGHRRQYRHPIHRAYKCNTVQYNYSPCSQKLTTTQRKAMQVDKIESWFHKRQQAFETQAYSDMQEALSDYKRALSKYSDDKFNPAVVKAFEKFLNIREKYYLKDSEKAMQAMNWTDKPYTSASPSYEKVNKEAMKSATTYYRLKAIVSADPTIQEKYQLQEAFMRLCDLRYKCWCLSDKTTPAPPKACTKRRYVKLRSINGIMEYKDMFKKTFCKPCRPSVNCAVDMPKNMVTTISEPSASEAFPIIWDSGASVCITFDRDDFLEDFDDNCDLTTLQGFSNDDGQVVKGVGTIRWYIQDQDGRPRAIETKAYYVPTSRVRLLSITTLLDKYQGETVTIKGDGLVMSGVPNSQQRGKIFAPINVTSKLPVSIGRKAPKSRGAAFTAIPVVSADNINLSSAEKELLRWHQRLGHVAFKKVQNLMKTGVLAHSEQTRRLHRIACRLGPVKCAACQYAKQKARSAPGSTTKIQADRRGALSQGNLLPGQEVCVDHFVCSNKGRLFTSRGATTDANMYCGGAIFIDQSSGHIHVEHQTTLSSHATLRAKEKFEAMCRDVGVIPQKYLSDNGTAFTSRQYRDHLMTFAQIQRFAGTGAHHHNSRAERAIQTIMSISRAMMMHCFLHWPDMEDTSLWPMAVNHAVYIWNHVPDPSTGLCPADLFTKTKFEQSKLHDIHVFGCPVYVLDKAIADGKKIPRWKPRSRRCMYLGRSASHASSVPILLNPDTGTITPQFHVVFDDWFATVNSNVEDLPDFNSDDWMKMFGDSTFQYMLDEADLSALDELSEDLVNTYDSENAEFARNRVLEAAEQLRPATALSPPSFTAPTPKFVKAPAPTTTWGEVAARGDTSASGESKNLPTPSVGPLPLPAPPVSPSTKGSVETVEGSTPVRTIEGSPLKKQRPVAEPSPVKASPVRRSTRTKVKPQILDPSTHLATSLPADVHFDSLFSAFNCPISINAAGKAANNPDLFTYEQAMASEDKAKWVESAMKEIRELEEHGCWEEVPISEAKGSPVIPSQWIFRLKRRPDGTVTKYKGRIVLRGDLMKDIHDKTSPVVAFSTVRIFLIMSVFLGWYTCSVDFANAFIQATRPDEVFMHVPRGFKAKPNHCLRLIKNIYGACDGPKLWAELLFKSLRKLGFTQSKIDPCLWYKRDCFIICFVDDCGISVKHEEDADKLIKDLENLGFSLTKESSFEEFLGIQYETLSNGDVELTQKGLISKILKATGLENCNPNRTPAKALLGKDPDGEPMSESWGYPSVIGMLLYLSTNTRPDITFAVSQAARFTHNPKDSHASAIKTIVRYLAKTKDKGTIVRKPTSALKLDCFVDADFAGLYRVEKDESVDSAKSRSGYIIKLGGCPLICKSQLIPTICLSTAESEYYSLSQSMRALLPIQGLLTEFMRQVDVPANLRGIGQIVHATTHEDNTAALSLATEQRLTSRTRHYHCRWHFFWQHVQNGNVEVIYCDTTEQDADYLTKALVYDKFVLNRGRVQGW